jgi:hypothetical protein
LSTNGDQFNVAQLPLEWVSHLSRPLPQLTGSMMTVDKEKWPMTGDNLPQEAVTFLKKWFNIPGDTTVAAKKKKRKADEQMTEEELINFYATTLSGQRTTQEKQAEELKAKDEAISKLQSELTETKAQLTKASSFVNTLRTMAMKEKEKQKEKKPTRPKKKEAILGQPVLPQPTENDLSLPPPPPIGFQLETLLDGPNPAESNETLDLFN